MTNDTQTWKASFTKTPERTCSRCPEVLHKFNKVGLCRRHYWTKWKTEKYAQRRALGLRIDPYNVSDPKLKAELLAKEYASGISKPKPPTKARPNPKRPPTVDCLCSACGRTFTYVGMFLDAVCACGSIKLKRL